MLSTKPMLCLLAALLILSAAPAIVMAQTPYPAKPIRLIVPYPPGGGNDTLARIFGQKLTESLGQQVIVENRAGAGTTIGTAFASRATPDVPTFAEAGMPEYTASAWYSVHAPAKTPNEIVTRLNRELVRIVNLPDIKERLKDLGSDGVGNTPDEFGQFVITEHGKYGKRIKAMGIKQE